MIEVILTTALPLTLTLDQLAPSGLFPQAIIYDVADAVVATRNLAEVGATGRYTDTGFTPGAIGIFHAHFRVFSDVGHTIESALYSRAEETFRVSNIDAVLSSLPSFVDSVLSASHGVGPWITASTTVVQLGMLSLGYTSLRAVNLDNLDLPISGLNDISVVDVLSGVVDATGVQTITVKDALQFSFASLVNTVIRAGQVYIYHDVGGNALWAGFDNDPISWGSSIV